MALDGVSFRLSEPDDDVPLRALLTAAELPSQDVRYGRQEFILAHRGGALVGSAGLERHGDVALLRSLAVVGELRGRGLGAQLYERIIGLAKQRGIQTTYLLTTTAERFFAARGFEKVGRAGVPEALSATPEFRSLCPSTAVCMQGVLTARR